MILHSVPAERLCLPSGVQTPTDGTVPHLTRWSHRHQPPPHRHTCFLSHISISTETTLRPQVSLSPEGERVSSEEYFKYKSNLFICVLSTPYSPCRLSTPRPGPKCRQEPLVYIEQNWFATPTISSQTAQLPVNSSSH